MIDLHIGCDSNDAYSSCTGGKVLDAGRHGCRTFSSCWIPHGSQVVVFILLLLLFLLDVLFTIQAIPHCDCLLLLISSSSSSSSSSSFLSSQSSCGLCRFVC